MGTTKSARYHYQIRHGLLLTAITGLDESGGKARASSGIYYVVPLTGGWNVMAYRYADMAKEMDHTQFWEQHVCSRLAGHWAVKVAHSFYALRDLLKEHPYGFPRGRVALVDGTYHVYHGSDLPNALGVRRQTIEAIFGVKGKADWVEDDHEHCLLTDKVAIREALALEEEWPVV